MKTLLTMLLCFATFIVVKAEVISGDSSPPEPFYQQFESVTLSDAVVVDSNIEVKAILNEESNLEIQRNSEALSGLSIKPVDGVKEALVIVDPILLDLQGDNFNSDYNLIEPEAVNIKQVDLPKTSYSDHYRYRQVVNQDPLASSTVRKIARIQRE